MALLKKIKASTLMETMVATVLIVVIFLMVSMLLNSLFSANIRGNTQQLSEQLHRLEYAQKNGLIPVPHEEEWEDWTIEMNIETIGTTNYLVFESTHKITGKKLKNHSHLGTQ